MGLLSNETRNRCVFFLSAESLISLDHVLKKKTCAIINKDVFLVMNTVANPSRLMF
jgi:hypothetical protein